MKTEPGLRETILSVIREMTGMEQIVTRETLSERTGLPLAVIDDRLSALIDNGDVLRVQRGVFIPASTHRPARVISRTIVPDDGTTVLEIGDQVVTLTPREARILGELMAGAGQNFASIELGHQSAKLVALLSNRVDKVSRKTALMGRFQSTPDVQSTPDAGRQQRLEGMTQ